MPCSVVGGSEDERARFESGEQCVHALRDGGLGFDRGQHIGGPGHAGQGGGEFVGGLGAHGPLAYGQAVHEGHGGFCDVVGAGGGGDGFGDRQEPAQGGLGVGPLAVVRGDPLAGVEGLLAGARVALAAGGEVVIGHGVPHFDCA